MAGYNTIYSYFCSCLRLGHFGFGLDFVFAFCTVPQNHNLYLLFLSADLQNVRRSTDRGCHTNSNI